MVDAYEHNFSRFVLTSRGQINLSCLERNFTLRTPLVNVFTSNSDAFNHFKSGTFEGTELAFACTDKVRSSSLERLEFLTPFGSLWGGLAILSELEGFRGTTVPNRSSLSITRCWLQIKCTTIKVNTVGQVNRMYCTYKFGHGQFTSRLLQNQSWNVSSMVWKRSQASLMHFPTEDLFDMFM